jgi:predicted DNA-binding transcriptional regulator AlpA
MEPKKGIRRDMQGNATLLVNEHQAAAMLGLSVKTLRNWRVTGSQLPHVKLGAAVRYSISDIQELIQAARRRSTRDRGPERDHAVA